MTSFSELRKVHGRTEKLLKALLAIRDFPNRSTCQKLLVIGGINTDAYEVLRRLHDAGFVTYEHTGRRYRNLRLTDKAKQWISVVEPAIEFASQVLDRSPLAVLEVQK